MGPGFVQYHVIVPRSAEQDAVGILRMELDNDRRLRGERRQYHIVAAR